MPLKGPLMPSEGTLSFKRGNGGFSPTLPSACANLMSKRCSKTAIKPKTCSLAITLPGQYVVPPPKGRKDGWRARLFFSRNREGSKSPTVGPQTCSLVWSWWNGIRIEFPGWRSLSPITVFSLTTRRAPAPFFRRIVSLKMASRQGQSVRDT